MRVVSTRIELREWKRAHLKKGQSIGFVPTMGALHQGHLSLVEQALKENDFGACSIFVNPTQFNNPEDLENYPRTMEEDLAMLESIGCHLVFAPPVTEMYPEGEDQSRYEVHYGHLETIMEGQFRPGHFRGVGLIVGKLFDLIEPQRAYFGEKDYQQLLVVRKLVDTLHQPVEVIGCPIVRESDGLAMSSRNLRLNTQQRDKADFIYQSLRKAKNHLVGSTVSETEALVKEHFTSQQDFELEYFIIADANSLETPDSDHPKSPLVGCISAFAGPVRLIDNMILFP